jgi:hypothetical protein
MIESDGGSRVLEVERLPLCTAGENACPSDDASVPPGYAPPAGIGELRR